MTKYKQFNMRLTVTTEERMRRLVYSMSQTVGFAVSQADVVGAGLAELEKLYPYRGPEKVPRFSRKVEQDA